MASPAATPAASLEPLALLEHAPITAYLLRAEQGDAMPEGGSINVRVTSSQRETTPGEWVLLEVQDQGRGIDSQTIGHVFDPFFTTKELGTGLGLASCYGVVQTHGGQITVESSPGQGACFRVALPRALPTAPVLSTTPAETTGRGCVLVIDDDTAVRTSTGRMLKTLGYSVLLAADGTSAQTLAEQHAGELHFMVCDLAMPHQSGPEVAAAIRRVFPDIKVLFVSGYPRGSERELPAASFLQKPYDREALARKLATLSDGVRRASG